MTERPLTPVPEPSRPPRRLPATEGPRLLLRRVVIGVILLLCGVGMAIAVNHTDTGSSDVGSSGGQVVEQLMPRDGAQALRQTEISIDLAPMWTGRLIVNGIPIPKDETVEVAALNLLRFQPGEGKAVAELAAGRNCVDALIWTVDHPEPERPQVEHWCFEVT